LDVALDEMGLSEAACEGRHVRPDVGFDTSGERSQALDVVPHMPRAPLRCCSVLEGDVIEDLQQGLLGEFSGVRVDFKGCHFEQLFNFE
jgi:hypothetical protein